MLPQIAVDMQKPLNYSGGWLVALSSDLLKQKEITLTVCFPMMNEYKVMHSTKNNLNCFGFPQKRFHILKYNKELEKYFVYVLNETKPDVVHIFGTEYPHTLAMVNTCNKLNIKAVISIQGLVSIIAHHYMAFVPNYIQYRYTFRDFVKQDNLKQQQKKFEKRGEYETEAIRKVNNVIGRTTWDKACTTQINSNLRYHFCNEILRDEFYKHEWSLKNCEKHSIFMSQATYPIKGMHLMLDAMPNILKRFPDTKLYVAGSDLTKSDTLKDRLKKTYYAKYIQEIIQKYDLKNNVIFTKPLNEKMMCERYLKSNVFVCPSSIENSSNSIGEAMILGVPCVVSDVGGVSDMIRHKEEGYVYQADAPYMLAYYVIQVFENEDLSVDLSKKARKHALQTHNKQNNTRKLMEIYSEIAKDE